MEAVSRLMYNRWATAATAHVEAKRWHFGAAITCKGS